MNKTAWILVLFLVLSPLAAMAEESTELQGDYRWGSGSTQPLRAEFIATGEGAWKVAFYFKHRGRPHTYRGTAKGSLTDGELSGTVKTEDQSRTFSFEGSHKGGTFRGTHYEVFGSSRKSKTGTLSLKTGSSAAAAVR